MIIDLALVPIWLEVLKFFIELFGSIGILLGVLYASKQIKDSRKIHEETLSWNRKTYTEEILSRKFDVTKRQQLEELFKTKDSFKAVPLQTILNEIKTNSEIKYILAQFLNKCEVTSRGVRFKIIDEEVVKESNGFDLIKIYLNYQEYIEHARHHVPSGLGNFISLIDHWKKTKFFDLMVNYSTNEN